MNVLLTGGSSFTGMWFAEALHAAGATVVAPLMRDRESYEGVRAARVRRLAQVAEVVPDCAFGEQRFQSLLQTRSFEVLCHHAAQVANYRSADFDVPGALGENTRNIAAVLRAMASRGLRAVVATGSVFEQDEGAGNVPLRAFSPYGLSKGLTWQVVRYWCAQLGLSAGKFVIANPFGPYEEPRFVAYLVGSWRSGSTAEVRTPRYLRDNIHVDLLALAYAKFVLDNAKTERCHGQSCRAVRVPRDAGCLRGARGGRTSSPLTSVLPAVAAQAVRLRRATRPDQQGRHRSRRLRLERECGVGRSGDLLPDRGVILGR